MLIPQQAESRTRRRQGSPRMPLAQLRRAISKPEKLSEAHRQRLEELARRAARVAALGDEYAGVSLSPSAATALYPAAVLA